MREKNYDALRVVSSFMIVMLHASSGLMKDDYQAAPVSLLVLHAVTRFAVPCFFMLSGAFLLSDQGNGDVRFFYRKSWNKIGRTGLLFCLLYLPFSLFIPLATTFILKKHGVGELPGLLLGVLKSALAGEPYYHLWYIFVLVGLYFAVPLVIKIDKNLSGGGIDIYGRPATAFLVLSCVGYMTSSHAVNWDIGYQLYFLSYFLMGWKIRRWSLDRKSNVRGILLIAAGFMANMLLAILNYAALRGGYAEKEGLLFNHVISYGPLDPVEIAASLAIFAGFSLLEIKVDFSWVSKHTFVIYLVHAGILTIFQVLIEQNLISILKSEALAVIAESVMVFAISLLISFIYQKKGKS